MRRRRGANLEHILLLILLGMVALAIVHYVTYRQRFPRPLQVGDLVLPGGMRRPRASDCRRRSANT